MMNWKGCGRKRSWLILRYYPGIHLEGQRKPQKKTQDIRSLGRYLNTGPPEYEAGHDRDVRSYSTKKCFTVS
jgi:hypothetical protein